MISRSLFRQSAAFLGLSLCILTDSTPRMTCTAQRPASAPQATPSTPQEGKRRGGEGKTRTDGHGTLSTPQMGTDGQRPPCLHLHHLPGGGRPAAWMICTTGQPSAPSTTTDTASPRSCTGQPSTLHNPSDTATACTGWERQGRGREGKERGARQNSPPPCRQSHIYRTDAHQHLPSP